MPRSMLNTESFLNPMGGGFLQPSTAAARRALEQQQQQEALAREQEKLAIMQQIAMETEQRRQALVARAAEQQADIGMRERMQGRQGQQDMAQLITQLQGNRAIQGDRLNADFGIQGMRGQQNMDMEKLRDVLMRGQNDQQFGHQLKELGVRHGYAKEMGELQHGQNIDLETLRNQLGLGQQEALYGLRGKEAEQQFQLRGKENEQRFGYDRQLSEDQWLEQQGKEVDQHIDALHQESRRFDTSGQKTFGDIMADLNALERTRTLNGVDRNQYLKKKIEIAGRLRERNWGKHVINKPGDKIVQGAMEGVYGADGVPTDWRLRNDASPEELQAYANSRIGERKVQTPQGEVIIPYEIDSKGTVRAGSPIVPGMGAMGRAGAGRAGAAANATKVTDHQAIWEASRSELRDYFEREPIFDEINTLYQAKLQAFGVNPASQQGTPTPEMQSPIPQQPPTTPQQQMPPQSMDAQAQPSVQPQQVMQFRQQMVGNATKLGYSPEDLDWAVGTVRQIVTQYGSDPSKYHPEVLAQFNGAKQIIDAVQSAR